MNTKRLGFWLGFVLVIGLIIWGLVVAMNRPAPGLTFGELPPVTEADNVKGPENPSVILVKYEDFQCPACAAYAPLVERLYQEASTTLQIVSRHFPLPQHANAMITAQAVEAAGLQGRFWEMYRVIYANQISWQDLSVADARLAVVGYARELGLDVTKFETDLDLPSIKEKIEGQLREASLLGVNSTPTFFVNGEAIVNPQGYEQFKALIDEAAR